MTWYPRVKVKHVATHTASIALEAESTVGTSDAELKLARILRTAAEDIERAVAKQREVMAP